MRTILVGIGLLVLAGCAPAPWFASVVDAHYTDCQRTEAEPVCRTRAFREWESYAVPAPVWVGDAGWGLMEPMPTGQPVPGTLIPTPILGEYWVTGQPTGTVHAR